MIATSDYMKAVADQVARVVPAGLHPLGTDGFCRSDTRAALRHFFEVDAAAITVAALHQLPRRGAIDSVRVHDQPDPATAYEHTIPAPLLAGRGRRSIAVTDVRSVDPRDDRVVGSRSPHADAQSEGWRGAAPLGRGRGGAGSVHRGTPSPPACGDLRWGGGGAVAGSAARCARAARRPSADR